MGHVSKRLQPAMRRVSAFVTCHETRIQTLSSNSSDDYQVATPAGVRNYNSKGLRDLHRILPWGTYRPGPNQDSGSIGVEEI
jgi:hypothetical protein